MTAMTIIRRDLLRPLTQIVGLDVSEDDAEQLIASGAAERGPKLEAPPGA
jgi:hypothetical protein